MCGTRSPAIAATAWERNARTYKDCFYYQARRRAWNADVLIVNHALFLSDLGLRRAGASLLPDYDVVIIDEAHTLEAVAGEHLGLSLTSGQFDYLLSKLYNDRTQRGLLVHHKLVEGMRLVDQVRYAVRSLFEDIHDWQRSHGKENGRLREPLEIENKVTPALQRVGSQRSATAAKRMQDEEQVDRTDGGLGALHRTGGDAFGVAQAVDGGTRSIGSNRVRASGRARNCTVRRSKSDPFCRRNFSIA